MNPEEMRAELEIFVNQGLQEGWRGWPRHDDRSIVARTDRIDRTNRIFGTGREFGLSPRSYGAYRSN